MAARIPIDMARVRDFCTSWKISELSLFGSAIRDDFGPSSDLDLLVSFAAGARWSLLDHVRMVRELEVMFGRRVDLVQEKLLDNPYRRDHILASRELIYAA